MRTCGAKRKSTYSRKTKNGKKKKTCSWSTAAIVTTKQIGTKIGNTAFLDFEIIIVILICLFDLTTQQDKNYIAFFYRRKHKQIFT